MTATVAFYDSMLGVNILARGKTWRKAKEDLFVTYDELSDAFKKMLPKRPGMDLVVGSTKFKVRSGRSGDVLVYREDLKTQGAGQGQPSDEAIDSNPDDFKNALAEALGKECFRLGGENDMLRAKLQAFEAHGTTTIDGKGATVNALCDPFTRSISILSVNMYEVTAAIEQGRMVEREGAARDDVDGAKTTINILA